MKVSLCAYNTLLHHPRSTSSWEIQHKHNLWSCVGGHSGVRFSDWLCIEVSFAVELEDADANMNEREGLMLSAGL
jgi:hypothetical protein